MGLFSSEDPYAEGKIGMPMASSRFGDINRLQNQDVTSGAFRQRYRGLNEQAASMRQDEARRGIAQKIAGLRGDYSNRGLLYSGLRSRDEALARTEPLADLAQARLQGNINEDRESYARENDALQSGFLQRGMDDERAQQMYNLGMQSYLQRKQGENALFNIGGQLAGKGIAAGVGALGK